MLDPLGNATHTSLRFDVVGEDVLITGAGPIGILATAIVRHIGARNVVVTDVNRYRLDMAAKHGASRVVDVRTEQLGPVMAELAMTEGFDVGLEMSGAEAAFNQMLDAMNNGGRIAALGIPSGPMTLDVNDVIFKGLEIQGIYGRRIFETWYKMAAMLQSGLDIGGIVTHELPADRFEEAFADRRRRRVRQGHPRLGVADLLRGCDHRVGGFAAHPGQVAVHVVELVVHVLQVTRAIGLVRGAGMQHAVAVDEQRVAGLETERHMVRRICDRRTEQAIGAIPSRRDHRRRTQAVASTGWRIAGAANRPARSRTTSGARVNASASVEYCRNPTSTRDNTSMASGCSRSSLSSTDQPSTTTLLPPVRIVDQHRQHLPARRMAVLRVVVVRRHLLRGERDVVTGGIELDVEDQTERRVAHRDAERPQQTDHGAGLGGRTGDDDRAIAAQLPRTSPAV